MSCGCGVAGPLPGDVVHGHLARASTTSRFRVRMVQSFAGDAPLVGAHGVDAGDAGDDVCGHCTGVLRYRLMVGSMHR